MKAIINVLFAFVADSFVYTGLGFVLYLFCVLAQLDICLVFLYLFVVEILLLCILHLLGRD